MRKTGTGQAELDRSLVEVAKMMVKRGIVIEVAVVHEETCPRLSDGQCTCEWEVADEVPGHVSILR